MTPEEIKRLRELHEAATPGEWEADQVGEGACDVYGYEVCGPGYGIRRGFSHQPDAECIAATHNALPQLLDEIERLQALVGLPPDASLQEQYRYHVRRSTEILVKSIEEKYGN